MSDRARGKRFPTVRIRQCGDAVQVVTIGLDVGFMVEEVRGEALAGFGLAVMRAWRQRPKLERGARGGERTKVGVVERTER